MSQKPFFTFGNTGFGCNINVDSLKFNNINSGFVYLDNTGLATINQVQTSDMGDSSVTTSKITDGNISSIKIASNINLSGIPTVDTGEAGNNTTQIASTAFVQTAINNLVNTAPATLNTLNELAIALGNDPNFSTTVTNNINGKVSTTGNEEISGIKTFVSLPSCDSAPTASNQLTNGAYVNNKISSIIFTTGSQGAQGSIGVLGLQGATGLSEGSTGLQGLQGLQGLRGPQGATGVSGGATGTQGLIGAQGAQGARGLTGAIAGSTGILVNSTDTFANQYLVFTNGSGSLQTLYIDGNTGPLIYNPNGASLTCNLTMSNPITSLFQRGTALSTQLGYYQSVNFATSQSITSDTLKNLGSLSLPAGTWIVIFQPIYSQIANTDFFGHSEEISTTSSGYDNNISRSQDFNEDRPLRNQAVGWHYPTQGIFYSGTPFSLHGNVTCFFTNGTVTATGSMHATRIA
jgi:hypothetical protein